MSNFLIRVYVVETEVEQFVLFHKYRLIDYGGALRPVVRTTMNVKSVRTRWSAERNLIAAMLQVFQLFLLRSG